MTRKKHNPWFNFKQFRVEQHQAGMRVTTHACLFGALIDGGAATRLLDIGTGTGLLVLMLAQRYQVEIDAVECDEGALADATRNFARSPWADRLHLHAARFQDYVERCPQRYDCIVSNPPFFSASMAADHAARHLARHDDALPLTELMTGAECLLSERGQLWLLLPDSAEARLRAAMRDTGLHLQQRIGLRNLPHKPVDRLIFQLGRQAQALQQRELVIYQPYPEYSEACHRLLQPYYASL